jgi:hypothetical protein
MYSEHWMDPTANDISVANKNKTQLLHSISIQPLADFFVMIFFFFIPDDCLHVS